MRREGERERALEILERFKQVVTAENVIKRLRKNTLTDPRDPRPRFRLIEELLKLERTEEAREELRSFRNYVPSSPVIPRLEGMIAEVEKRNEKQ